MGSKEQGNTDKSSKSCMCVVELSSPRIVLSVIYYGCLIPAIIFPFIFLVIVLSAMIGSVFCGMREGVRMGLGLSVLKKTSLFITKLAEGSDSNHRIGQLPDIQHLASFVVLRIHAPHDLRLRPVVPYDLLFLVSCHIQPELFPTYYQPIGVSSGNQQAQQNVVVCQYPKDHT